MDDETIKLNIRSALQGLIEKEKDTLRSLYNKSDDDNRARVAKLRPVFDALLILKGEIGDVADISIAQAGHMATVEIENGASSSRMSISTNYGGTANSHFTVDHKEYFSWTGDYSEKTHHVESGDEVLRYVMAEVSKAIASQQVLAERKK